MARGPRSGPNDRRDPNYLFTLITPPLFNVRTAHPSLRRYPPMPALDIASRSLLIGALFVNGASHAAALPDDWRAASGDEVYYESETAPLAFARGEGDFDGDGITDSSMVAVQGDSARLAILVETSSTGQWHTLQAAPYDEQLGALGITIREAGSTHTGFCAPSVDGCADNGTIAIKLALDGLSAKTAYGTSLYVWDADKAVFTEYVTGL